MNTIAYLRRNCLVRDDLPVCLNHLNLVGYGAEIGVGEGLFSAHILKHWLGKRLFSIDPWKCYDNYDDVTNLAQEEQNKVYREARAKLKPFGRRSKIIRQFSHQAAPKFINYLFDFIYLDANHSYEYIKEDINLWWPRLNYGGVLAGHDYLTEENQWADFGVKKAVDEFVQARQIPLHITMESHWRSWMIVKM